MLENVPSKKSRHQVFRLAYIPSHQEFLEQLDFDSSAAHELEGLLSHYGIDANLESLLDSPFQPKRKLSDATRFSDGSYPVFYSSWEAKTAEAEIKHSFPRYAGRPNGERSAYYQQFSCTFEGIQKDLRKKIQEWPSLVDKMDYSFCNQIGEEARRLNLDGLVTVSVRVENGTNLPIFFRRAVSEPKLEYIVKLTFDPNTNQVSLRKYED